MSEETLYKMIELAERDEVYIDDIAEELKKAIDLRSQTLLILFSDVLDS